MNQPRQFRVLFASFRISHESKQVTLSLTAMPGATVDSLHSLEAMVEGMWLYR